MCRQSFHQLPMTGVCNTARSPITMSVTPGHQNSRLCDFGTRAILGAVIMLSYFFQCLSNYAQLLSGVLHILSANTASDTWPSTNRKINAPKHTHKHSHTQRNPGHLWMTSRSIDNSPRWIQLRSSFQDCVIDFATKSADMLTVWVDGPRKMALPTSRTRSRYLESGEQWLANVYQYSNQAMYINIAKIKLT